MKKKLAEKKMKQQAEENVNSNTSNIPQVSEEQLFAMFDEKPERTPRVSSASTNVESAGTGKKKKKNKNKK